MGLDSSSFEDPFLPGFGWFYKDFSQRKGKGSPSYGGVCESENWRTPPINPKIVWPKQCPLLLLSLGSLWTMLQKVIRDALKLRRWHWKDWAHIAPQRIWLWDGGSVLSGLRRAWALAHACLRSQQFPVLGNRLGVFVCEFPVWGVGIWFSGVLPTARPLPQSPQWGYLLDFTFLHSFLVLCFIKISWGNVDLGNVLVAQDLRAPKAQGLKSEFCPYELTLNQKGACDLLWVRCFSPPTLGYVWNTWGRQTTPCPYPHPQVPGPLRRMKGSKSGSCDTLASVGKMVIALKWIQKMTRLTLFLSLSVSLSVSEFPKLGAMRPVLAHR
jgi:hypothetical protein